MSFLFRCSGRPLWRETQCICIAKPAVVSLLIPVIFKNNLLALLATSIPMHMHPRTHTHTHTLLKGKTLKTRRMYLRERLLVSDLYLLKCLTYRSAYVCLSGCVSIPVFLFVLLLDLTGYLCPCLLSKYYGLCLPQYAIIILFPSLSSVSCFCKLCACTVT